MREEIIWYFKWPKIDSTYFLKLITMITWRSRRDNGQEEKRRRDVTNKKKKDRGAEEKILILSSWRYCIMHTTP